MKTFKQYLTEAEIAAQPAPAVAPVDEDPPIDSAESYKAWLQKAAAADGLSPEDTAALVNMTVTDEDGSIDMDATMVKTMKAFADILPPLLDQLWSIRKSQS